MSNLHFLWTFYSVESTLKFCEFILAHPLQNVHYIMLRVLNAHKMYKHTEVKTHSLKITYISHFEA